MSLCSYLCIVYFSRYNKVRYWSIASFYLKSPESCDIVAGFFFYKIVLRLYNAFKVKINTLLGKKGTELCRGTTCKQHS